MPPSGDPRAVLAQLVVRLRGAAPGDRAQIVHRLLPLLAKPGVPLAVRYAAAARAIDALPDRLGAIRGVVRALTGRLPPARALARLRHLQHLTERATALDALVARRERKVKTSCPRCAVRLPRAEMAKHLWHEHGLELAAGKVRAVEQTVAAVRTEHAATGAPALIDRAAALAGTRVVGEWAAQTATAEEVGPLCAAARARGAGLCPVCFADVRPVGAEPPPVLAVARGRVAGDGFVAKVPVLSPPRVRATLAAAGVMLTAALIAPVGIALALSALAYLLGLIFFRSKSAPDDLAINAAWASLARKLVDRRDGASFLARLCVTSAGRGDPFERANALNALAARARAHPAEYRLLAVTLALQVDDGARFGRDHAAGVADLIGPALGGEYPADFAELVLTVYFRVPRAPGELARLRVLLLAKAFAAGCAPREVLALCDVAPHVARAVRLPPAHVALLYGVWTNRGARTWGGVGRAQTVFDLAAAAPTTAGRLLKHEPGLLLVCGTDPGTEAELGPVLVALGGVSVGGAAASDPATDVRLESRGRELIFGKSTLRVSGRLPETLPAQLRGWLRFRAEMLATFPATFLDDEALTASGLLAPFAARCPSCGVTCVPVIGAIARPLKPPQ